MKTLTENFAATRRGFLKMMGAMGALGAVTGCGSGGGDEEIIVGGGGLGGAINPEDLSDLTQFDLAYATCPHNCGTTSRCVSRVWTKNGRIVRVTTDDSEYDHFGNLKDKHAWNDARQLSCAKGHAYRYRVYHTGRIKYPMKQTKKRGDVTGFVRISWQQAYNEVMRKYRAIYAKYGPAAIYAGDANGSSGTFANPSNATAPVKVLGAAGGTFSTLSFHQYYYVYNIVGVPNSYAGQGDRMVLAGAPGLAGGGIKHLVSFGSNVMSTNNGLSYPYLRSIQKARALNPNFKHYVIAPEFCDTGVVTATDWVQIRNYTDAALLAAMMYEMLINTFDTDGSVKSGAWLDVNYIDTVLYGFFDSPRYWINTTGIGAAQGEITLTDPSDPANWRLINAVPSGQSYASWLMGRDDRLTRANYSAGGNYTAQAYGSMPRAGLCSLPVKGVPAHSADMGTTNYHTKKNYMEPKTPEWAEKICGTPAAVIRELAWFYCNDANKPFLTEWAGGFQKAENGPISFWALQTLFAITKNWGYSHGSTGGMYMGTHGTADPAYLGAIPSGIEALPNATAATPPTIASSGSANPTVPAISCKEHFNGLYMAFKEVLDARGFTGRANPYWDGSVRYLNDDAGAKTQVLYKRSGNANAYVPYTDLDSRTYYDFVGRDTGGSNHDPVFVGKRMYIGSSGAHLNQIANPNWAAEIFSLLPLAHTNPDDADTFCLAYFDAYMSPQARFADYVFPLANTLEVVDNTAVGGAPFRRLPLSTPPGEAKDTWEAGFIAWNEQSKLGNYTSTRIDDANAYNKAVPANAGYSYIGTTAPNYISIANKQRQAIQALCNNNASRFRGMTVEEAIAAQIIPKTPLDEASVNVTSGMVTKSSERLAIEAYLATSMTVPFIDFTVDHVYSPSVTNAMATFTTETAAAMPGEHGRMTCFAEYAVYTWEHAYDIYHGWLPAGERGQRNKDYENDPMLYPIPMYYHFEDACNEAYGVFNPRGTGFTQSGWYTVGPKPETNDLSKITDRLTLTVGTTHDRYNTHSSQIENPYLRELNHRIKGGGWASGNDWNEYCVVPEVHPLGGETDFNPMISSAIQKRNMLTASWKEFWMNNEDAAQFGIRDGDLIRVSNPVGAIRAIARVSKRLIRGHGQIHQGGWYDPNPADGVDDGGCANTLMSNRASKFDNGNSVQFSYCLVEKEIGY
jgi:anaerobic selenocysteine-containing dehydrogenase